jgi:hypothetical protein
MSNYHLQLIDLYSDLCSDNNQVAKNLFYHIYSF